ncbi:hypothetical protein GF324_04580 [bacterium]|nr:hypothetical protein [bacterium]
MPIMNLMVVLIPMLLSLTQFIQLALMQYNPPPVEEVGEGDDSDSGDGGSSDAPAKLDLLLNITEEGFELSMFGKTKGDDFVAIPKVPLTIQGQTATGPDGQPMMVFDYDKLHEELVRVRKEVIGDPIHEEEITDPETGEISVKQVFKYEDAQQINIAAKGDTPWQVLVSVLDELRTYKVDSGVTNPSGEPVMVDRPLFPVPRLGQLQ